MSAHCKKEQIYHQLRNDILNGIYQPGSRLPRETILAEQLGVSQVTLRSALMLLQKENLVERLHGVGTFVSNSTLMRKFLFILPYNAEQPESPSRYVAEGVDEAAQANGCKLNKLPVSWLLQMTAKEYAQMISDHHISGIIYETGHMLPAPELIPLLKSVPLPVVIPHGCLTDSERTGFSVLRTDERSAFGDGLRHLIQLGHRRIATLLMNVKQEDNFRVRGFTKEEIHDFYIYNGLESPKQLIRFIPENLQTVELTVRELMLGSVPPTAFMCHSDVIAMSSFSALKKMHVKIPQQVSVMGYNNFPGCQLLNPPLSTIDIGLQQCGKMAIEHMIRSSEWFVPHQEPPEILTPYSIIERASTAHFPHKS